jgi:hypothetical protein
MAALAFAVVAEPAIDDSTPYVGQTVTASSTDSGTWQWFSCGTEGCTPVGTESSYPVASTDEGRQLKVELTVAGTEGSESAQSPLTAAVTQPPPPPNPAKIDSLTISGAPYVDNQLNAVYVLSGGEPTSTSWQWSRCGAACVPVGTSQSYTVKPADVGSQLVVQMTVSNADGGDTKTSPTGTVPDPPEITSPPEIFPDKLSIGNRATTGAEWRYNTTTPKWQWLLCNTATVGVGCAQIAGATTRSYVVGPADAGSWLGVSVTVQGRGPDAVAYSEGRFISKPEDPVPPTPPAPFTSTGTTPDTPTVIAPKLLDPFPIVRIKGRTTRVGARLSLLSVRAPRGTRIRVRCRSDYCPRSRLALNTRLHRLRVFERSLRAGVVIEVRVMHPKKIGKYTRFLIRRAAPPLRRDACLAPGSRKPTRCPGS